MKRGGRLDLLLTLVFMALAITTVVLFVGKNQPAYMICGGIAITLRIIHYIIRFLS
jgi:hypothetical protein